AGGALVEQPDQPLEAQRLAELAEDLVGDPDGDGREPAVLVLADADLAAAVVVAVDLQPRRDELDGAGLAAAGRHRPAFPLAAAQGQAERDGLVAPPAASPAERGDQ